MKSVRQIIPLPLLVVTPVLAFLLALILPNVAHAGWLWDQITDGFQSFLINNLLLPAAQGCCDLMLSALKFATPEQLLTGGFTNLFGNLSGTIWGLVNGINETLIRPVAHSLLALFMLVQVVKISGRIDSTATLPALKDILFLVVFFVIFTWVINNAADICISVYDLFANMAGGINNIGTDAIENFTITLEAQDDDTVATWIILILMFLLGSLVALLSSVVVWVVSAARGLQLYAYAAFSPIPLAMLGFEETRSSGISFIKNFCALCLTGAIIMFLIYAYPALIGAVVGEITSGNALELISSSSLSWIQFLAYSILFIFALIKSGSWAKEILGT